MDEAIADILVAAIGMVTSPIPVIAAISVLVSPKARTNGAAFAIGWLAAMGVMVGLIVLLTSPDEISGDDGTPATTTSVIKLVLGLVLLAVAYRSWQKRPREGETPKTPGWMASLDQAMPLVMLGLGAGLASIYPKSLVFNFAAGISIAQADLATGGAIALIVVYVLLASLSVVVPVIWCLAGQESAAKTLAKWKIWLTANNATVVAVVSLVFGVMLTGQGLGGLID
jgi:hypothetical protein